MSDLTDFSWRMALALAVLGILVIVAVVITA